jgi:hypothetical protein
VPCVAVVENMCHFDADGKRYYPFGRGSGSQAWIMFLNLNYFFLLNHILGNDIDIFMMLYSIVYCICLSV